MPDTPKPLTGPETIAIRRRLRGGPFGSATRTLPLAEVRFDVVNTGAAALTLDRLSVDPVRSAGTGLAAPGRLAVVSGGACPSLPPASAATLALSGELPGQPGTFVTSVRVGASDGTALACPVAIEISAQPLWGFGAMLLGLLAIGVLNLLADAGDVRTMLRHALDSQQAITVLLERTPPPAVLAGERGAMDDDFTRAIALLERPRSSSLVDRRLADARPLLDEADRTAARLRGAVADIAPGETETQDLDADWKALQPVLQQMEAPLAPQASTPPADVGAAVAAFLAAERDRLVRRPAIGIASEIDGALGRIRLEAAAGNGEEARDIALNTRSWLRRSALSLERGAALQRESVAIAVAVLNDDRSLHARLAGDDMPAATRAAIEAMLAAAEAKLAGHPSDADMREANALIGRATTARMQARLDALRARIAAAFAAADQRTDIADIQTLLDQLNAAPRPHTLAMKQAGLGQVIRLWRAHVTLLPDPAEVEAKDRELDAIQADLDGARLTDAASRLAAFFEAWPAEFRRQATAAADRLEHRDCVEYGDDLERREARIAWELRALPQSARVARWDGRLDGLRFELQRSGPDAIAITHDCLARMIALDARIAALGNEMLAVGVVDMPVPDATRLRLLAQIPNGAATGITAAAILEARHLALAVTTPADERVAGRAIRFRLEGDDPNWGVATRVGIDFGDRSGIVSTDAETLRRTPIEHGYARAVAAHLTVRAVTEGVTVGHGVADMVVRPSPATGARIVADEFVSLRFGLALAIAAALYFWRYRNGHATLGARAYDYVEAFALGFVVYAAVSDLPKAVAGFVT